MISHAYPRYATNELDTAFRTAAAKGEKVDIQFMKATLAKGKLDINAKGKSGLNALHQACRYGRVDSVNFLLANGADTELAGPNNQTCADFTKEAKQDEAREDVLQALKLFQICKKTYKDARSVFPEKASMASDKIFDEIMGRKDKKSKSRYDLEILPKFKALADKNKLLKPSQISAHDEALIGIGFHFVDLLELNEVLTAAKQLKLKAAYCGAVCAHIFCSMLPTGIPFEQFSLTFPTGSHGFIIFNRAPGSNERQPDTWGKNAYFVDSNGSIYSVRHRPDDSILNDLSYSSTVEIYITSHQLPDPSALIIQEKIDLARATHKRLTDELVALVKPDSAIALEAKAEEKKDEDRDGRFKLGGRG